MLDSPDLLEAGGDTEGVLDPLDWLSPLDVSPEFLQDVFPPHSPATPVSARHHHQDLGCDLLGEGNNSRMSMRTAFSLNDLTSLQSTHTTAPSWAHTRSVSNRPGLETVPEGAPAALGCFPQQEYMALPPMYHDGLGFIPSIAAEESSVSASAFSGPEPSYSGGAGFCEVQQVMLPPMFGAPHSPAAMRPGSGMPGQHSAMTSAPPKATPAAKVANPATPGRPVRARRPTAHPPGFINEPPEQLMADPVKLEQVCDTDSSANAFTRAAANHAWMNAPSPAPTFGNTMRKSASALELGAWRKIAAGGMELMDCIDPSGSVREQLHGLDAVQVGKLTPQERLQKILRYRAKRQMRNFNRTIKYQCRKSLADTRPRVRGRFARDNEPGSVLPHETKKALRTQAPGAAGEAKSPTASAAALPAKGAFRPTQAPAQAQAQQPPLPPMAAGFGFGAAPASHAAHPASAATHEVASSAAFATSNAAASPAAPEQQGTAALAHLYNQWCEGPMDTPPMRG